MSDTRSLKKFLQSRTRELVPSPHVEGGTVRVLKVTRIGWSYQSNAGVKDIEFSKMTKDQISKVIP